MARNRSAGIRPLSDEQEMALGSGLGIMLVDKPGETKLQTVMRVFGGSFEAAKGGYYANREYLLALAQGPGTRPPGYWLVERGIEPPDIDAQEGILRGLGLLTADEEAQLAEWAAMRTTPPPAPMDLGIDQVAIAPRGEAEVTNDIASADVGTVEEPNGTHKVDGDPDAGPVEAAEAIATAEEGAGVPETPVTPPRILPMRRGIDSRRPASLEGWETE